MFAVKQGIGLFLALAAFCWAAEIARADGLIITDGRTGGAGPQVDAAAFSPAPRTAAALISAERTYVVQRGDTLSSLALRFDTSVAALMARNNLTNADRVDVGRVLKLETVATPIAVLPPDGPLTRLQFWPWPLIQGQTLVVWLQLRAPITPTLSFRGQTLPVTTVGRHAWAMAPIPALAAPATEPLTVTLGGATVVVSVAIRSGNFEVQEIPAEASDPILSAAAKVNSELMRLTELLARIGAGAWTPASRFRAPLDSVDAYERTSPFGARRTYGDDVSLTAHTGEDFAAPLDTPVLAPAAGRVVLAEPLFVRGNAVILDHGRGVYTGYWHLASLGVKAGDEVTPGRVLGTVGSTGLSTGAHLHWELRVSGVAVDPLQWVENSK